MDKIAMFKIVLNRISSIQKMGYNSGMKDIPVTISEIVDLYHTDRQETKDALNELVKLGMLSKILVSKTSIPMTKWDSNRGFKSKEYKEMEYSLTTKAEEYVNSLKNK